VAANDAHLGLLARRRARQTEQASAEVLARADTAWQDTIRPHVDQLGVERDRLVRLTGQLESAQHARRAFFDANPETISHIGELNRASPIVGHQTCPAIDAKTWAWKAVHGSPTDANRATLAARIAPSPQQHGPQIKV
jgi:hypothetical protein